MKLTLYTTLLVAALQIGPVETLRLRGGEPERHLESDYYFIVSQISQDEDWCLTAVEGTKQFGNLGLKRCDFVTSLANQVWKRVRDGKFHSQQDFDLCMVVGYSKTVFDGVRMRLADCDNDLTMFSYDGDYIKPMQDDSFCITNRGPNPDSSDTIHGKPCIDRADYKWTLKEAVVSELKCMTDKIPSSLPYELVGNDSVETSEETTLHMDVESFVLNFARREEGEVEEPLDGDEVWIVFANDSGDPTEEWSSTVTFRAEGSDYILSEPMSFDVNDHEAGSLVCGNDFDNENDRFFIIHYGKLLDSCPKSIVQGCRA